MAVEVQRRNRRLREVEFVAPGHIARGTWVLLNPRDLFYIFVYFCVCACPCHSVSETQDNLGESVQLSPFTP